MLKRKIMFCLVIDQLPGNNLYELRIKNTVHFGDTKRNK